MHAYAATSPRQAHDWSYPNTYTTTALFNQLVEWNPLDSGASTGLLPK